MAHFLLQAPQLWKSLLVSRQRLPQRVWPCGQTHLPFWQSRPGAQELPQEPQLRVSLWRGTHWLLQQARPWLVGQQREPQILASLPQLREQAPPTQF